MDDERAVCQHSPRCGALPGPCRYVPHTNLPDASVFCHLYDSSFTLLGSAKPTACPPWAWLPRPTDNHILPAHSALPRGSYRDSISSGPASLCSCSSTWLFQATGPSLWLTKSMQFSHASHGQSSGSIQNSVSNPQIRKCYISRVCL